MLDKRHFKSDKNWSDAFLPEIKSTLGLYLIGEPPIEEDVFRNTDLITLNMKPQRIACRIRKHQYLKHYGDQFTIRKSRPSGTKTELAKILEGWGDYIFYGICDADEFHLSCWVIGDLKIFRNQYLAGNIEEINKCNKDNSSTFAAFTIASVHPNFVVAQKGVR